MAKKKAGPENENLKGPDIAGIEEEVAEENSNNIVNIIWDFFSSMRVGIILLLVLAVGSIVGTVIPQNAPPEAYNPSLYSLYSALGFTNVYSTIWFKLLLFLLCMNLLICSLNRVKIIKKAFEPPKLIVGDKFLKSLAVKDVAKPKGATAESLADAVACAIRGKGYRVFTEKNEDKFYIAGDKGNWGTLGSFTSHISFVIIVVGAIIGGLYGFDGDIAAPVGTTFRVSDVQNAYNLSEGQDFQVRVDNFRFEQYENGAPKDWFSDLTVIDDGKEVFSKSIEVNDPLKYKGITFYQSYYGSSIMTNITYKPQNISGDFDIQLSEGNNFVQVPNTPYYVQVVQYVPDFDPNNPTQSKSDKPNNPGVFYNIYKDGSNAPIKSGGAEFNKEVEVEDIIVKFTKYNSFTGLSVKKDPGVPVVWFGCGLLVFGMILSFVVQHRKIWAVVTATGAPVVEMGAITTKHKLGLQNEFKEIMENISGQFRAEAKGREK